MQTWLFPSVISTLTATLLMILSYGYIYEKEKNPALKYFIIAWIAYAFRFVFRLFYLIYSNPFFNDLNLAFTLFNGALLFIASRKMLEKRQQKTLNILFLCSPVLIPVLKNVFPSDFFLVTIIFIISGIFYLLVGLNYIKSKGSGRGIKIFIGVIFIIWGLHKFDYPVFYNSVLFAPVGYLIGAVFALLSALSILMLYYELNEIAYKKSADELRIAKEELERSNRNLKETKDSLKLKLNYILNSEINDIGKLKLTDIIDVKLLQNIQDTFAEATGVAAIITNINGEPLIKPSNFTGVCKMIRRTERGLANCIKSDHIIGEKSTRLLSPVFEECRSCGFVDAAAPIIVGEMHIANWMIGQANLGKTDEDQIQRYADKIGCDSNELLAEYRKIKPVTIEKFEKIVNLLWVFSRAISRYAYNNLLLTKKLEEEKQIKIELENAKNAAEESDRLKTAFLSNVSHEIRTPLNGILGFADLFANQNITNDDSRRYIDIMQQSGQRLLRTIDDLIDISIIESGQIEIINTATKIGNIINEIVSVYKPEIESKCLDLILNIDRDFEILTDEGKLKTILSNVLRNAVKYTNAGHIEISVNDENDSVHIEIADTGIGIPEKRIDSIYNRFEQVEYDFSRSYEGAGLGLSIAKEYVEAMGGAITVKSQVENPAAGENGWSRFLIKLPKEI